jgi:hypothetical protein
MVNNMYEKLYKHLLIHVVGNIAIISSWGTKLFVECVLLYKQKKEHQKEIIVGSMFLGTN